LPFRAVSPHATTRLSPADESAVTERAERDARALKKGNAPARISLTFWPGDLDVV